MLYGNKQRREQDCQADKTACSFKQCGQDELCWGSISAEIWRRWEWAMNISGQRINDRGKSQCKGLCSGCTWPIQDQQGGRWGHRGERWLLLWVRWEAGRFEQRHDMNSCCFYRIPPCLLFWEKMGEVRGLGTGWLVAVEVRSQISESIWKVKTKHFLMVRSDFEKEK